MALAAISDLHICDAEDPMYVALLALIRKAADEKGVLVLAGDVFDLFVGNKAAFRARYSRFFEELRAAGARGAEVHYIEGNHDFQIRSAFEGLPGVRVHPREVALDLGGKRFLFTHGDLVDRGDYGYLALRAFFRSPVARVAIRALPGGMIERVGEAWSRYSRSRKPVLPAVLPIERRERLRRCYRSFAAEKIAQGYDFVVMGHCHDLDEMSFQVGGRPGQYVNVGFPRIHGSYLSWHAGDAEIRREKLPG